MIEYKVKVDEVGTKVWYLNGQRHREDGPAIEWPDGGKEWWLNGQRHREDGPAREFADGAKSWWLNGQRHREDGPAIEFADGDKSWYLNDEYLTAKEFNKSTQVQELTIQELEAKLGYKIKVVGE